MAFCACVRLIHTHTRVTCTLHTTYLLLTYFTPTLERALSMATILYIAAQRAPSPPAMLQPTLTCTWRTPSYLAQSWRTATSHPLARIPLRASQPPAGKVIQVSQLLTYIRVLVLGRRMRTLTSSSFGRDETASSCQTSKFCGWLLPRCGPHELNVEALCGSCWQGNAQVPERASKRGGGAPLASVCRNATCMRAKLDANETTREHIMWSMAGAIASTREGALKVGRCAGGDEPPDRKRSCHRAGLARSC